MRDFISRFRKVIIRKIVPGKPRDNLIEWVSNLERNHSDNFGKILEFCEKFDVNLAYLFGETENMNGFKKQDMKISPEVLKEKMDSAYRTRLKQYIEKDIRKLNIVTLIRYAKWLERNPYEFIGGK